MHLEVYICPDQARIDGLYRTPLKSADAQSLLAGHDKPVPDRFIVTCYEDVEKWGQRNIRRMWPGIHWYCINVGKPDGELMYFEMPRGNIMPEDRLWPIIDFYAAFYEDIP